MKEFNSPAKVSDEALQFHAVDNSVEFKTLIKSFKSTLHLFINIS